MNIEQQNLLKKFSAKVSVNKKLAKTKNTVQKMDVQDKK